MLLEPRVKLKVAAPNDYQGAVMGDISKRRGRICDSITDGDTTTVIAEVPLSETYDYTTDLRGMTRGRGKFSTEFLRYEEVPYALAEKIIAEANKD